MLFNFFTLRFAKQRYVLLAALRPFSHHGRMLFCWHILSSAKLFRQLFLTTVPKNWRPLLGWDYSTKSKKSFENMSINLNVVYFYQHSGAQPQGAVILVNCIEIWRNFTEIPSKKDFILSLWYQVAFIL